MDMPEITETMGPIERYETYIVRARLLLEGGPDARGECDTCHQAPLDLHTWPGADEFQECQRCITAGIVNVRKTLHRWRWDAAHRGQR